MLLAIGENPYRPGLVETPYRWAKMWREFIEHDPGMTDKTFVTESSGQVTVAGMRVWSMCEHHMLPFWCDVSISYVPKDGVVLGLSKFARIAEKHAHRLQIQERLVEEIAEEVKAVTGSEDVAVIAIGQHLCMVMRGVEVDGRMVSTSMHGVYHEGANPREEFLRAVTGLGGGK